MTFWWTFQLNFKSHATLTTVSNYPPGKTLGKVETPPSEVRHVLVERWWSKPQSSPWSLSILTLKEKQHTERTKQAARVSLPWRAAPTCSNWRCKLALFDLYLKFRVWLFATQWTVWSPPGSFIHKDSPGKNIGVGCHALLQGDLLSSGIEPTSLMSPTLAGRFFTTWHYLGSPKSD